MRVQRERQHHSERSAVRKALLPRVGMDRGTGGALGLIFPDGTFEYVPVPETAPTSGAGTYATLPGRHARSLASVLPARVAKLHPHIDPDFTATTYGDAAPRKRRQLLRLEPGDLLVFYTGLLPRPPDDRPKLFAIGFFKVNHVHDLTSRDLDQPLLRHRFGRTAHFLRRPRDRYLALVEGEPTASQLFARAVPLGDGRDCLLRDLAGFGYEGSLLRAVGHWLKTAAGLSSLEAWLRRGPCNLVSADTRMISTASPIRPATIGSDVAVDDPRLREGDWIIALPEPKSRRIQALARVNRVARVHGRSRAFSSVYWCFTSCGPMLDRATFRLLAPDRLVLETSLIRRLISRFGRRYRIGLHSSS